MSLCDDVYKFGELQRGLLRPSFTTPGARESWEKQYPRLLEEYFRSVASYCQFRMEHLRNSVGDATAGGVGGGRKTVPLAGVDLESRGLVAGDVEKVAEVGFGVGGRVESVGGNRVGGVPQLKGSGVGFEGTSGLPRGPNWERNRASRDKKKRQKQARDVQRASPSVGAGYSAFVGAEHRASVVGAGSGDGVPESAVLVRGNQEGFWNSCSKEVRQELIDSKARMHIAENLRKVKEAEEKVRQMESPEALLVRAMGMVTMAEQCAKKSNDSKVAGWAQTVATSYAESIAKSAPSSVPSYASVVSGSSATSVSVDGTKRVKPTESRSGVVVSPAAVVAFSGKECASAKGPYPDLTVRQVIDVYGLRVAESKTESDLDKIVTEVAMDDRIVGMSSKRITSMVLEKRWKFRRAADRAEVQRLGGVA